jgi:hypothetical protein
MWRRGRHRPTAREAAAPSCGTVGSAGADHGADHAVLEACLHAAPRYYRALVGLADLAHDVERMSKLATTSSRPVVRQNDVLGPPWQEPDWQRLWLATQLNKRPWRSLALVPGGAGMPPRFMEMIAISLSRTGMTHLQQSIHIADATQVGLEDLNDFFAEVSRCTSNRADRVVIALAPLADNVTSVSIAQACDCALLCILRGFTETKRVKQTIAEVGAKRFIGSVMFDATE